MQPKLVNQLPEEIINDIYRKVFTRLLNGSEFQNKMFSRQIRHLSLSLKQRRNILAYHNHPTI